MIADLVSQMDAAVVDFVADLARQSEAVDRLVMHVHRLDLFKGGVLMALIAWIWFSRDENRPVHRPLMIKTILAGLFATVASRVMQNFLPPRGRPMNAASDFVAPFGLTPDGIEAMSSWSSFPSDHAALFFALATGVWLVSRRLGAFALAWTLVAICLPRIYLGLHYASDIIGGAVLGIAATLVFRRLPDWIVEPVCRFEARRPGPFYATAFLFTFEFAGLFWESRSTAMQIVNSMKLLAAGS